VGQLEATRTFQDDAKVRAALLKYYETLGLLDEEDQTNAEKLAAVLDYWIDEIRARAKRRHMDEAREAARAEADALYDFE
jgi:hypothetical protein